jgi:polyvinyl alcohol dehydrogenase (cytochrome)
MSRFTCPRLRQAAALGLLLTALGACATMPPADKGTEKPAARAEARAMDRQPVADRQRDLFNHHADQASPISANKLKQMKLAWSVPTQAPVSHTPLVDGDRVYFADWGGKVYAVDAKSGRVLWQKQVQETVHKDWPWHGIAGTGAMSEDLLFEASVEGMAYAIDKRTGEVVWKKDVAEDPEAGSLARMLHYDGLVYIGLQSVEEPLTKMKKGFKPDFRGKVMALDARTGQLVWERWLVEPPHNGVPVWSSFALDPATNTLFFTTGNNYTGEASPLSDSLVAADAKTGQIKWHRQVTMHDVWTMAHPKGPDYDFGAGQKSGVFYVWDRVTGEPVWSVTLGYGQVGGGIHGEASVTPDRILLWSNNAFPYKEPEKHPMDIAAVDPATGKFLWVKPKAQPAVEISAGFAASDVYFVGSLDGKVRAYNANTGDKLWTSQPHGSVASSIWVDGERVMWGAGVPKRFGGNDGQNGVFAYVLDGGAG